MNKIKEYHLYLDESCFYHYEGVTHSNEILYYTYTETQDAIFQKYDIIHSTQVVFLSFDNAERLFVHVNGEEHEITLGECDGTNRDIKKEHNLVHLLMAGEFDWFREDK